jgi:hypothetical protein
MYRPLRTFWGLAAIGGAIAVGLTTHNAAYIVITFLGGLIVPRVLGLAGPGWRQQHGGHPGHGAGCGAAGGRGARFQGFMEEWHRQAHAGPAATPPA